ncbi:MAG: hypothetical protein OXG60_15375 [Chloroflexi bacterium]|nr:hypothetical protein [Chloroflexota bacterium]
MPRCSVEEEAQFIKGKVDDRLSSRRPGHVQRAAAAYQRIPWAYLPLKAGVERYGYGFGLGFRVMFDLGQANGYSSIVPNLVYQAIDDLNDA